MTKTKMGQSKRYVPTKVRQDGFDAQNEPSMTQHKISPDTKRKTKDTTRHDRQFARQEDHKTRLSQGQDNQHHKT